MLSITISKRVRRRFFFHGVLCVDFYYKGFGYMVLYVLCYLLRGELFGCSNLATLWRGSFLMVLYVLCNLSRVKLFGCSILALCGGVVSLLFLVLWILQKILRFGFV